MSNIYFDTSSIVKVYHKESDSDNILNILPQFDGFYLSELTKIEFVSAFWKKVKY
jgi:predicted nucleic acid-binding protein